MKISKIAAISTVALAAPMLALAQASDPFGNTKQLPTATKFGSVTGILSLFRTLTDWAFTILIALSVVFVLYAAFLYLTAGGEQEKVKKANYIILYAAISIAIAVLAKAVPGIVASILGVSF
jgi:hypothetical protein